MLEKEGKSGITRPQAPLEAAYLVHNRLQAHRNRQYQAPPGPQGPPEQQASAKYQAPPELINQLKNQDSSVRRNAAETIGTLGDENAIEALIPLLKDDNRFVRQEAVWALAKIGGARALEALTQALVDEKDEFVRDSIKKAMERLQ
jgi:HEAT repeat protein